MVIRVASSDTDGLNKNMIYFWNLCLEYLKYNLAQTNAYVRDKNMLYY